MHASLSEAPLLQVLFASDADLSSPIRKVCLDGVIVHRSDDRRPFVVEARKSIFQEVFAVPFFVMACHPRLLAALMLI